MCPTKTESISKTKYSFRNDKLRRLRRNRDDPESDSESETSESDSDSNQFLVRNCLRRPSIYNQAGRLIDEVMIESARII